MAAQLKTDGGYTGVLGVRPRNFTKLVSSCENPPKASPALRALMADAKKLVKKD